LSRLLLDSRGKFSRKLLSPTEAPACDVAPFALLGSSWRIVAATELGKTCGL